MTQKTSKITLCIEPQHEDTPDDLYLYVSCGACENVEGQPADQQRSHLQSFSFDNDNETYTCPCGETLTESDFPEPSEIE